MSCIFLLKQNDQYQCVFVIDVAEWMMNRSVYCCSGDQGQESGETPIVEYSFQFLEDFQDEYSGHQLLSAWSLVCDKT